MNSPLLSPWPSLTHFATSASIGPDQLSSPSFASARYLDTFHAEKTRKQPDKYGWTAKAHDESNRFLIAKGQGREAGPRRLGTQSILPSASTEDNVTSDITTIAHSSHYTRWLVGHTKVGPSREMEMQRSYPCTEAAHARLHETRPGDRKTTRLPMRCCNRADTHEASLVWSYRDTREQHCGGTQACMQRQRDFNASCACRVGYPTNLHLGAH